MSMGLVGVGIEATFRQNGRQIAWCNFANIGDAHSWIDDQFAFYKWGGAFILNHGKVISSRSITKPAIGGAA